MPIVYIALGSALGGVARYLLSKIVTDNVSGLFPWGTFLVNIVGCLLIGLIYGLLDKGFELNENMRLFLTVGFCGGFTTFSTFAHENFILFQSNNLLTFASYTSLSLFVGLLMAYLGHALVKLF